MPIVDVEENIKRIRMNIEQQTQEVFRLQGMLRTFEGFKDSGLKTIDLPHEPENPNVYKEQEQEVEGILRDVAESQ